MASTKDLLALSEGILAETPPVEEVPVTNPILDDGLKAIVVPDSYVDKILGLNESSESVEVEKPQQQDQSKILEQKVESLIERLKSLLGEARDVLQEMTGTGTGSIGVGVTKPLGMVRRKDEPCRSDKRSKRRRR